MKKRRTQRDGTAVAPYLIAAALIFVMAAASSWLHLMQGNAASYAAGVEAEAGVTGGAAARLSGTAVPGGASAAEAVRFAGGGQTPQGQCVVAAGQKLQDQDLSDSAETPWKRSGPEVIIYFETGKVIAEHAGYITKAAEYWGRSPCLDTRAAVTCPSGANCITAASVGGKNGDTDGEFTGRQSGGFRTGGHVELFTDVLNQEKPNGRLVTTVHEYGHGVGLIHRKANVMMNETTDDSMDPEPDAIDYQNLLVIYGTKI